MTHAKQSPRRGVTLVELMVVIVIIVILAGLIIAGVFGALGAAEEGKMTTDLNSVAGAVETYKKKYGAYPPDFSDSGLVRKHWYRRFPDATEDPTGKNLTPAQALVFWLQGFKPDPLKPMTGSGQRQGVFDFDQKRLIDPSTNKAADPVGMDNGTVNAIYVPVEPANQQTPYVYFDSRTYASVSYSGKKPYKADSGGYVNPGSFQLICAGRDGNFGAAEGSYPSGQGYAQGDQDNFLNTGKGGTLQDQKP